MKALELNTLLKDAPSTRLLDVRTPPEFENAHISGAYNVPLQQLHEHASEVRAATGPVVLICQSGQRAVKAETMLRGLGMANVRVLEGGMSAWMSSGLPTERIRARMSLERQVRILAGAMAATGAILALTLWPLAAVVPALIGTGLVFAGVTDTCAMGMLLARLPYNRGAATCDTEAIVREFLAHERVS
ncbi:MAG TPA: rhodanese-like domain-containing protein [Vicinamibacterales bacterium]|nr:rhodanese-like domain-containing protein [Vicinamibacterales bacterium]